MTEKEKDLDLKFEEALNRLEEIVEALESGGLSLDDSLDKYTEGIKLIKYCNQELNKAEKKIEMVLKDDDDEESTTIIPYDEEEV